MNQTRSSSPTAHASDMELTPLEYEYRQLKRKMKEMTEV